MSVKTLIYSFHYRSLCSSDTEGNPSGRNIVRRHYLFILGAISMVIRDQSAFRNPEKSRVCFSIYAWFEFDVLNRQLLLPVWGLRTYCSHISLPEFQLPEGEYVQENSHRQEHSGKQQVRQSHKVGAA